MNTNKLLLAALLINPDYSISEAGSVEWWVASGPGELPPPKHATLEAALQAYVDKFFQAMKLEHAANESTIEKIEGLLK